MSDYALNRAATALAEVLRARRPDLSWEVTVGPNPGSPGARGPGGVARLIARDETMSPFVSPNAD